MRRRSVLLLSILVVGLLLLGPTPTGIAEAADATFVVSSTLDLSDNQPGDGICLADGDVCTLRAAIQEANALAGTDTIVVPAGTYQLTIDGTGDDAAASGDLDITDDVIITGEGAATTIIDGNALDRVFHVLTAGVVSITGTTIQNGLAPYGGGIANESGQLSLDDVAVQHNASEDGGGIWNAGWLSITASSVSSNETAFGGGGGISNQSGVVNLTNTWVDDNFADVQGGGILSFGGEINILGGSVSRNTANSAGGGGVLGFAAAVSLTGVDVIGNSGDGTALSGPGAQGGGVAVSDGSLAIYTSRIDGNYIYGSGGGIFVERSAFTIDGGTVSGNTARFGGGIYGSGAISNIAITANYVESTFDEGGVGGGIYGGGTLVNVTISGNIVESGSGTASGTAIYGGGTLLNVTIADNVTSTFFNPDAPAASPIHATGAIEMVNTIVADASGLGCDGIPVTSLGHNLDQGTTCGLTATGDQSGVDPLLRPLGDYGGLSPTHALPPDSPATDAGDNAFCPLVDQRGQPRPIDGNADGEVVCDSGAVERQAFEDTTAPVISPIVTGQTGLGGWYTSDVSVTWAIIDDESDVTATEGCDETTITADTAGTTLTCVATSAGGTTEQSVTIKRDATAPTIAPVSDRRVTATGRGGSWVAYATPAFEDGLSGKGRATCTPPSGRRFALGATTVTCTASDEAGNTASTSFRIIVTYSWSGLLSPINPDGSTVKKAGSMLPVKFRLTGASASVTDATAKLTIQRVSDGYRPVNAARFTYNGQYMYDWKTTGLAPGQYRLTIDLGDGDTTRTVIVTLR